VVPASTGSFYGQPMTAGDIYTIAGDGNPGLPGWRSRYRRPARPGQRDHRRRRQPAGHRHLGVRVRVVAASTDSFYGQPMIAGDIYTIAGDGDFGFSGDGGPATAAALSDPAGVTTDAAGNVLIADSVNNRIRVVRPAPAASTGSDDRRRHLHHRRDGDFGSPATAARPPRPRSADRPGVTPTPRQRADRGLRQQPDPGGSTPFRPLYGQPMTGGDIYTSPATASSVLRPAARPPRPHSAPRAAW